MGPGDQDVAEAEELYELDPSEFVAARDALARRLREAGDREAAQRVKKLRRPTVTAWALNQVARREPAQVERLIETGAAVRELQAAVLEGGDVPALREATRERRDLVAALAAAASELAGPAHHDEAAATLEAASIDEGAAERLRAGRLSKELPPPSGFGFAGMPDVVAAPRDEVDQGERERRRAELDRAEHQVRASEERLREVEDELQRVRERLVRAERAAEEARAVLDEAHRARDRAAEAVSGIEPS